MKQISFKILAFIFVFSTFVAAASVNNVSAQEKSQRWVCLKADRAAVHAATVSVDPKQILLPNSDTYVFECLSDSECTSGNAQVDQDVFGVNKYAQLKQKYGYQFEGSSISANPAMSDGQGQIPSFSWRSSTDHSHARRWLAMNYFVPQPPLGLGEDPTQQLGTFTFENAINKDSCVSLSWDPYGRVFDSQTLDPLLNASVTLLLKRDTGDFTMMTAADLLGGNLVNPQTTGEDGGFSFVVPDGTYKLNVSLPGYSFPEEVMNIKNGFSKLYSDIYPGLSGEEIVQAGVIQHRDVPLKPLLTSQDRQSKILEYFYDLDKANSIIIVQGRTSHPFTSITAYSMKPDPITGASVRFRKLTDVPVKSDKLGNFRMEIRQADFEPTEIFGELVAEKNNLADTLSFIHQVFAADTTLASSLKLEPIPNYIEGYAYDNSANPISNAKVSVYLNFSDKPSYVTSADSNGYFKIGSEFLPPFPYHLVYTTTGGTEYKITTSKYIAQNSNAFISGSVKPNQFTNQKGEVVVPTAVPKVTVTGTAQGQPANTTMIILVVVILFLFLMVTGVIVLMKKSRENNPLV